MPTYSTRCDACRELKNVKLTFHEYDQVLEGTKTLTCDCENHGRLLLEFTPEGVKFVMKDGEHGGWISKGQKENTYRAKRANYMKRREKENVFVPKLQPNFGGEETGTWKEAQEEARRVKGDDAASTYEPLVNGAKV